MDQIQKNQTKTKAYSVFSLVVLIVIALLFLFPFYWIITGSFKVQPNKIPPEWFPASWTVMHWEKLFRQPAWTWFFNSVFMSVMSMILVLMASSMAGYVLAKKAFTGRKIIFSRLVMAMALPKQVILVPLVRMMNALSLYNTLWAVILGTVGIPTELLEAAKIDGSGETRTFLSVVCPMLKPAFGALAIFTFINTWNDYFLQLVMLTSRNNLSISLGIATLQAELSTDYGLIMAGATLGAVPIVTIFVMFQKYFTNGIALGAVKG